MKKCIIIGQTNVGKTVFAIQFARFVGVEELTVAFQDPAGKSWSHSYTASQALAALASPDPHQTRCLQAICLELPVAKGFKRFEIVDTSGLIEGIHAEPEIRRAMAQTLSLVRTADLILHIIDAAEVGKSGAVEALGEVDYQVAQFAQMRGAYALLANKMDLPGATAGLVRIRREFVGHPIIPISALHQHGFREVKRFVWRWI